MNAEVIREESCEELDRRFLQAVCCFVILLITAMSWAQQQPQPDRLFTGSVRVDVINVEVYVTDRHGNPVFGLEREDFELLVKGRPMEISNFYAPPAPEGAPAAEKPMLEVDFAEPPPRHLAVLVDQTNLLPTRREAVMAALRTLVSERVALGDRVMVATYDDRIDVLSGFGDGTEGLERALDSIDTTAASAFSDDAEFRRILRCIEVSCNEPELIWDEVLVYTRHLRSKSRKLLAYLGSFVDSMAGLPGRRALPR